ncbi:hypothetical protein EON65_44015 [archaeon]|nr:MAG: hypothetical protein EON65_44015 [archaeon]
MLLALLLVSAAVSNTAKYTQHTAHRRHHKDEQFDLHAWKLRQAAKQHAKQAAHNTSSPAHQGYVKLKILNEALREREDLFASSSLPSPYNMLSFMNFTNKIPLSVTDAEREGRTACSFRGAHCPMETVEHSLVQRFIRPDDVVLEVGVWCMVYDVWCMIYGV